MRHSATFAVVVATGLAALALGSAVTPAVAIETIDCSRDRGSAEKTICSSQKLQTLDAQVTEAYADIMLDGRIKGQVKSAVHESQLSFLARRDACGRDVECLTEVMERRASRINFYR